ncbi:hypothetical protein A1O7_06048 [Cladophialophora yegresii CBS 114405]|uniref:Uncharacterized protein n=1 Tax=Cladophialophora yegresii CBS 114405 TaxID=1182544 RepID=W9W281_9EURO|nr:uncharacterized protein A1O7_06048 [Cladophialophora yegresii CBS 114405]EXJ58621.1 hypothetical protein A1O7_06048 [Cladophialophora yegresii CBS 114405]
MSDPNPYVSNGTCYTARGERLDGSFVPCGNDAFGHQTCCGAGDNCLADNACFGVHGDGYGSYLTYLAGCTDPDYEASTCPQKEIDQPWVALTHCDGSNGEWAICSQDGNPSTLQPGSFCSCTNAASATIAFSDSPTLTSIASLPQGTGQSIQFFVGHFPSSDLTSGSAGASQSSGVTGTSGGDSSSGASSTGAPSTSSSTTVITSSGATITVTTAVSTTTPTGTAGGANSGTTQSGLSSGAKAGIGAGVGGGALILLGILLAFFLRRRKRRRSPPQPSQPSEPMVESTDYDTAAKPAKPRPSDEPPMSTTSTVHPVFDANGELVPEADGRPAYPWALRNELEGSQPVRKPEPPPIAELPGSERFAGEQGAPNTLAHEANVQIGPGWQGNSLMALNSGAGKEYMQSSS